MDQPLFGEARPRDRYINFTLIIATVALYLVRWLTLQIHKSGYVYTSKETVLMAFIAGFLLDGKKCKRLYGHNYKPHFCVYALDIILCLIILALLGSQGFVVS